VQSPSIGYLVPRPLGARATAALSERFHRRRASAAHPANAMASAPAFNSFASERCSIHCKALQRPGVGGKFNRSLSCFSRSLSTRTSERANSIRSCSSVYLNDAIRGRKDGVESSNAELRQAT
jgi:hypothetical protein